MQRSDSVRSKGTSSRSIGTSCDRSCGVGERRENVGKARRTVYCHKVEGDTITVRNAEDFLDANTENVSAKPTRLMP